MDAIRHKRLEDQLLSELATLILSGEIKDPRVGPFVSLTRVEASSDLSAAKVFVSAFSVSPAEGAGETDEAQFARIDQAVEGLTRASGFIQSQVARRIRLRLTPKLTFLPDRGIKEGFELTERMKGLFQ